MTMTMISKLPALLCDTAHPDANPSHGYLKVRVFFIAVIRNSTLLKGSACSLVWLTVSSEEGRVPNRANDTRDPRQTMANRGGGDPPVKVNTEKRVEISQGTDHKVRLQPRICDSRHTSPPPLRRTDQAGISGNVPQHVTRTEAAPELSRLSRGALAPSPQQAETITEKTTHAPNKPMDPLSSKFFFDMANTISLTFPFQTFAEEHRCAVDQVNQA